MLRERELCRKYSSQSQRELMSMVIKREAQFDLLLLLVQSVLVRVTKPAASGSVSRRLSADELLEQFMLGLTERSHLDL